MVEFHLNQDRQSGSGCQRIAALRMTSLQCGAFENGTPGDLRLLET